MQEKNWLSSPIVWIGLIVILLCCCCLIISGAGLAGYLYLDAQALIPTNTPFSASDFFTPTPFVEETPTDEPLTAVPTVEATAIPTGPVSTDTLETLEQIIVPVNDPNDLARRLEGKTNIPETAPSGPFSVGATQKFWVSNNETHEHFQVQATLQYVTDHSYFWIEDGVRYDKGELKNLAETFENKIYPTDREFFGSEWTPGIDEDPHIYILYARGIGSSIAGYYSAADSTHPLAYEYSNAHEMFVFNADNSDFGEDSTYSTLAHEFQHMIHAHLDRNETSWLNEGFSELAAFINGYNPGGFDYLFISDPDMQLTDWPNNPDATGPHYGSSFLFTAYFLDRFGEQATQALVRSPLNGMDSVDDVLQTTKATDSLTSQPIRADDLYMDWAVANYLGDDSVADGRFAYQKYTDAPQASDTDTLYTCPTELSGTVNQYGTDYIKINCNGKLTLRFEGATRTQLIPADAYSGKYAFWSNKGDSSDMRLTQTFDFSGITGPIEMTYQTWFDIEDGWDYVYVVASTDGEAWTILKTPAGRDYDPQGNAYGWGYTGISEGWKQEAVDLSQFAGQKVQIRFEYVTDAAVNGEGLLLDDISIPAINYSTDFESDAGGWQSEGFARIENVLPQTFRLALILDGGKTTVQTIEVGPDQTAEISLDLGTLDEAVLVVSGVTRFTRETGSYNITIK